MKKRSNQQPLKLEVTDFGPIARAEIDLRPLTVFIGPSNAGKSYLAILIYALHNLFGSDNLFWNLRGMYSTATINFTNISTGDLSDDKLKQVFDWVELNLITPEEDFSDAPENVGAKLELGHTLPSAVTSSIRSALRNPDGAEDAITNEISRCFGVGETKELIRHGRGNTAKVVLRKYLDSAPLGAQPFEFAFSLKGANCNFTASIPTETPLPAAKFADQISRKSSILYFRTMRRIGPDNWSYMMELIRGLIAGMMPDIIGPLNRPAFYLPAGRAGVMHAHRVVAVTLIGRAAYGGLHQTPDIPTLSGVLSDFLKNIIKMSGTPRPIHERSNEFARHLERDILKGSVQTEFSDTGYPSFSYRPDGWKHDLPLMSTSSMVSELAPLVLYLRHLVQRGDTLIIEEPESHLHPAMQAEFAQHLAGLARAGIHVIVTTHSEWLLDQFTNLVRMSGLKENQRKGLPGGNVALHPDQFGAWLFKPKQRPKGTVVEEIKIDPDAGGLLSDYSDIAEQLFNTWSEIGNRIAESKDGEDK